MDWAQITLGALTVLLAILIIAAVVLVVLLIRLSRQIKAVSSSMGQAAKSFDDSAKKVNRLVGMAGFLRAGFSRIKKRPKDEEATENE